MLELRPPETDGIWRGTDLGEAQSPRIFELALPFSPCVWRSLNSHPLPLTHPNQRESHHSLPEHSAIVSVAFTSSQRTWKSSGSLSERSERPRLTRSLAHHRRSPYSRPLSPTMAKSLRCKAKNAARRVKRETGEYHIHHAARLDRLNARLLSGNSNKEVIGTEGEQEDEVENEVLADGEEKMARESNLFISSGRRELGAEECEGGELRGG